MLTMLSERRREKESAFTLIELLVVMIIIAILMAVAVPTFLKQKSNAVKTQATSNVKQVATAIEACASDSPTGSYSNCVSNRNVEAVEPTLKNLTDPVKKQSYLVTGTATSYSIKVTNELGSWTEDHTAAGAINHNCTSTAGSKACDTTATANKMW